MVQSSTATPTIGAVEQPAGLEPVEGIEGHHLREVAGDPEDHEKRRRRPPAGSVPADAGRVIVAISSLPFEGAAIAR
jgi:hypothetical protein